jgi:hypothetical protein
VSGDIDQQIERSSRNFDEFGYTAAANHNLPNFLESLFQIMCFDATPDIRKKIAPQVYSYQNILYSLYTKDARTFPWVCVDDRFYQHDERRHLQ